MSTYVTNTMTRDSCTSEKWVFRSFAATCCFILPLAALITCTPQAAWGIGLKADGILTVNKFGGLGTPIPMWSSTNQFRASMSPDGRWSFEVRPTHEQGDVIYLSYDGTNTFFARYREAVVDANQNIIARKPLELNVHPGYVNTGNYPFAPYEEQKRVHVLWLAYGAGKYLHDSATNNMILPWLPGRWSLLAYGFRIEYDLSVDPPYLPRKLEFIRDAGLDLSDESEMERPELELSSALSLIPNWKEQLQKRRSEWSNGFVAGKLQTSNATNSNGMLIPLTFSFTAHHPRWAKRFDQVRWRYEGTITNLASLAVGETFLPPIIAPLHVQDSRFRSRDATRAIDVINYVVTNSWLPRDSVELQTRYKAALGDTSPRVVYSSARSRRILVVLIFAVVSLSVPVILFRRAKKQQGRSPV